MIFMELIVLQPFLRHSGRGVLVLCGPLTHWEIKQKGKPECSTSPTDSPLALRGWKGHSTFEEKRSRSRWGKKSKMGKWQEIKLKLMR